MPTPIYQILHWSENFENNRSRSCKELRWCALPNRFDGSRITELIQRGGAESYGAWCAFVLLCSRSPIRGQSLKSNGQPYTAAAMAHVTGLPRQAFERMLALACDPEVALLRELASDCQPADTQPTADRPEAPPPTPQPADSPPTAACQPPDEGMEWNGMEGTLSPQPPKGGRESEPMPSPAAPEKPGSGAYHGADLLDRPSILDWIGHAGRTVTITPDRRATLSALYRHYQALGWTVGGRPVVDWRALVDAKLDREGWTTPPGPEPQAAAQPIPEPPGWQDARAQLWPHDDRHEWIHQLDRWQLLTPAQQRRIIDHLETAPTS